MSRHSLRALLSFVEKFGTTVVPARSVEALASADARAALHAAGVIAPAAPGATWPCEVRGCAREVRANYDGARKPLVAVCCQAPPVCGPIELGFDEVAHQQVLVAPLVRAVCVLLDAIVNSAALATLAAKQPIGEARPPVLVATIDAKGEHARPPIADPAADVFWAASPRDIDLGGFCARRERVIRRTLVLVPTSERIAVDVAARFAPGEHVELRALADTVEVRGGVLALGTVSQAASAIRASSPPPADLPPAEARRPGIAALLGVTRWEEIRLTIVDGHTLRIEANEKTLLRTFVELGFVDGRKTDIVTPVTAWALLLLFCKKGVLRPSEYGEMGKAYGAKKTVERLGPPMREAFGLDEHPIHTYSRRHGRWLPRFRVAPLGAGGEIESAKPGPKRGRAAKTTKR